MPRFAPGIAAIAIAFATPSQAELVSAKDPYAIAKILKEKELPATVNTPEEMPPFIESEYETDGFLIFFEDCDEAMKNCKTIQFFMGYNNAKETTLEQINEWNRTRRFTVVYRDDEGDPVMEMDLDLDFDGLPKQNVDEAINIWLDSMNAFNAHIFPPDDE